MTLVLAFVIGIFAGLRSLTPPAATAWAAYLGWLTLASPYSLIGSVVSVGVFTVLALAEMVADKLPNTPSRTAPPGLVARVVMGGLVGLCVAAAGAQSAILGGVLGAIGGVAGCFGGYFARTRLVKALGVRDFYVALLEDMVAIAGSLFVLSRV